MSCRRTTATFRAELTALAAALIGCGATVPRSDATDATAPLAPDARPFGADATAPDAGLIDVSAVDARAMHVTHVVVAPRLGDVWGGQQNIRWMAADSIPAFVTIRLARTATGAFDQIIEPGVATEWPNLGVYPWDSRGIPDGSSYRLRVTLTYGGGALRPHADSAVFVVDNTAPVLALAPLPATATATTTIRWTTTDANPQSVAIALSADGGATFNHVLVAAAPDEGEYDWDTTGVGTGDYRLRLVATDAANNVSPPVLSSTVTVVR